MKCADITNALRKVQKSNSREWYMQQKALFREIREVLNEIYFEVGNELRKAAAIDISPEKSISRPYNDQRFGHKPYLKEELWITFQSNAAPAPAFFIEFSPYGIRIGMGYYSATPEQMRNMRMKMDNNPQDFSDMIEKIRTDKEIQIIGESYKRKFESNYEGLLEEIYNYRSIYFQKIIQSDDWENLEQISKDTFLKLAPLYGWFLS